MTRIVSLSMLALLLGSSLSVAADPFAGKWVNTDEKTDSITRLQIKAEGDSWVIQAWGKCHPTDCDWGKAPLHVLGDSPGDKEMKYGLAHWDHKFADAYITLHFEKGELVPETYEVYKDKSGRSNFRHKESFKKGK